MGDIGELRDAGRAPPAVAGASAVHVLLVWGPHPHPHPHPNPIGASAVHVLLVWDGREFRTSTRLAPIDLQPAAD